jgi:Ras homolog gene family, member A
MGATYVECSSKEMRGVDQVFELAVNTVIEVEENLYDDRRATSSGGGVNPATKIKKRTCKIL